jgi:hypothetical protein
MRQRILCCRAAALITVVVLGSCCSDDDGALSQRVYLPEVPRDEIVGQWIPRKPGSSPGITEKLFGRTPSPDRRLMVIRPDGTCTVSPEFAHFVVDCEHASPSIEAVPGDCVWRIETKDGKQGLSLLFAESRSKTLAVSFGAFRHLKNGDVALLGTCGWGDAYGLYRPEVRDATRH